ncbi:MAG TPA: 3'-5' exonuclease [Acidimicrobiales bacterium]
MAKKYYQVPELILGFDTETTGLSVNSERAISYGFCAYRFGQPVWSEHFFVVPDRPITPGAYRVHRLSLADIEAQRGQHGVFDVKEGLARATSILRRFHERGAYVVGSNVSRFDLEMLRRSSVSLHGPEMESEADLSGLRVIDVVEHDLAIEPSRALRPRRGLTFLSHHYGVKPGGHDALEDARAAVEVFFEQVSVNNAGQISLLLPTDVGEFRDALRA